MKGLGLFIGLMTRVMGFNGLGLDKGLWVVAKGMEVDEGFLKIWDGYLALLPN